MQKAVSASAFRQLQSQHRSKETLTQRGRLKTGAQLAATGVISTQEDQSPASELTAPASISKVQLYNGENNGQALHQPTAAEAQVKWQHPALEGTEADGSLHNTGKYNPILKRTVQEVLSS